MSVIEDTSPGEPVSRSLLSRIGLVFGLVLIVVLGASAWAGYQSGVNQRAEQARATQTFELQQQFDLGVQDLAAQRYRLAADRFQYILDHNPQFPGAADKLRQAQAGLNATPIPTQPPAPPTPEGKDPAKLFAVTKELIEDENWDAAIAEIAYLRSIDPDYEPLAVDNLLYMALRARGVARIQGEAMEAGIADLDYAATFRPLDDEARSYRAWARLYLAAKSYYGVDWQRSVEILSDLYLLAPNFKDTTRLYYQSLLGYAAQLAIAGDACAAAEQYAAAQQLVSDQQVADTLATAQVNCLLTPTPEPTSETPTPDAGAPTTTPTP